MRRYDKGKPPPLVSGDGRFCGTKRAFRDGALSDVDPPLVWSCIGVSTCCLAKHGINHFCGGGGGGGGLVDSHQLAGGGGGGGGVVTHHYIGGGGGGGGGDGGGCVGVLGAPGDAGLPEAVYITVADVAGVSGHAGTYRAVNDGLSSHTWEYVATGLDGYDIAFELSDEFEEGILYFQAFAWGPHASGGDIVVQCAGGHGCFGVANYFWDDLGGGRGIISMRVCVHDEDGGGGGGGGGLVDAPPLYLVGGGGGGGGLVDAPPLYLVGGGGGGGGLVDSVLLVGGGGGGGSLVPPVLLVGGGGGGSVLLAAPIGGGGGGGGEVPP